MIIGLIPARSGSRGVPNKNIRLLKGYPLMAWAIVASQMTEKIDKTVVTTDSDEYRGIAERFGAEVITRPSEICGDMAGDITYVEHALGQIPSDLVVLLRPTSPLRSSIYIDYGIGVLLGGDFSGLRSVHQMSETAFKAYLVKDGKLEGYTSTVDEANEPRQKFKATYKANGYVDIVKPESMTGGGIMFGNKVFPLITLDPGEIDREEDFDYVECRLEKYGSPIYEYLRNTFEV